MDAIDTRSNAARISAGLSALERERTAFSAADMLGRSLVADMMASAGLLVSIDSAFNVIGVADGTEGLPPIVLGSHLDTVRDPGRFDGALGVLSAIECSSILKHGAPLRHPLMVVGFSDEEGSLTYGSWGARAMTGQLSPDEKSSLADPSSALTQALLSAAHELRELGWETDPSTVVDYRTLNPACYLELHIEQGPVLEREAISTGAVTAIVGINRYEVSFAARSGHAGTVPMADRSDDAVMRMAQFVRDYWAVILSHGSNAVVNFGTVDVRPGNFNVIPGSVTVAVEIRSPEAGILLQLEQELEGISRGPNGAVVVVGRDAPVGLDPGVRRATLEAAEAAAIGCHEMPSWAGHDAAVFAERVPTGMIFVPSVAGASHCPSERTEAKDIETGLRLLVETTRKLDERLS